MISAKWLLPSKLRMVGIAVSGRLNRIPQENTRLSTLHNSAARAVSLSLSLSPSFFLFLIFPPQTRLPFIFHGFFPHILPSSPPPRISEGGDKESLSKEENEPMNGSGQCRGVRPRDTVDCPRRENDTENEWGRMGSKRGKVSRPESYLYGEGKGEADSREDGKWTEEFLLDVETAPPIGNRVSFFPSYDNIFLGLCENSDTRDLVSTTTSIETRTLRFFCISMD